MIEWKPVKDYEGVYEVSNQGDVRRIKGGKGTRLGTCLSQKTRSNGYREVNLCRGPNDHRSLLVHRLVAEAFIGPADDMTVNHKNFDKTDNRIKNLEVVSQADNNRHCVANGRGRWATRTFDIDAVKRDEQGRFAA